MSARNQNRQDLVTPTEDPLPAVHPLGKAPLHGPRREEHIIVVIGVGPGLGLAIAQVFASQGYTVAILSRTQSRLDEWAKQLDQVTRRTLASEGVVAPSEPLCLGFAADALNSDSIKSAIEKVQSVWPNKKIGTACFNASVRKRGPFLEQREEQIREGVEASILAGFTFAQATIRAMEKHGQGGSLLITGATSSTRGREGFAGFAASKSGLRSMTQSIAREFGPRGIHVCHIVVDGLIESDTALRHFGFKPEQGQRFANGTVLWPAEMAKAWLFLAAQSPSTWTAEMDMRPAKESF